MKNFFYTGLLLLPLHFLGQAVRLEGYVTEMNSGRQKVKNVLVSVAAPATANPVLTNTDGSFILYLQNMQPGQAVVMEAKRKNWVVVNTTEMDAVIPASYRERPLVIVMCLVEKLEQTRKQYYKITDSYIEKEYKKRLDSIDRKRKGWQQKVKNLQEQLAVLKKQVAEIADEYSRTNIDDLTGIEKKAIDFFKAGKIDSSIALRETLQSAKNLKSAIENRRRLDSLMQVYKDSLQRKTGFFMPPRAFSRNHQNSLYLPVKRMLLCIIIKRKKLFYES